MNELGAATDSPARKLVAAARTMEPITGVTGVISADRIFSLLEREFTVQDISREVAIALRPAPDADLSAHKLLVDLSRGSDRKVRLVTTNFDLLFEAACRSLSVWQPPNLLDPTRHQEFAGIVHLHGRVDSSYRGALGDGFVLSSAEFGRAYLSDGWATQFIRAVTDNYLVVFLGYTADDPPVQYLLEALHRTAANQNRLFAFQSGTESDAQSRWQHKGVYAVAYDPNDSHVALWTTLEAWATRARNPARWSDGIIRNARRGPEQLLPHERGQIVHVVLSRDGASRLASAPNPPPATWLCVFDPVCRYATPARLNLLQGATEVFDPFDAYGLDTDPIPLKIDPSDYQKRQVPENVRDAFALTPLDREDLRDASSSAFRGQRALASAAISPRLGHLATWLANVADQPAAVWWAAGQQGLNPDVQSYLQLQLQRPQRQCAPAVRHAWQYLFESWRTAAAREVLNNYALKQVIDANGWNALAVQRYGELCRPYLNVTRPYWTVPRPPNHSKNARLRDLVNVEIEFPHLDFPITVPDEYLGAVLAELRQNLGRAIALGHDGFHGVASSDLPPIEPDPNLAGLTSMRDLGLSGTVASYRALFSRLLERDPKAAKVEVQTWLGHDDLVFTRLTIWACNDPRLVPNDRIGPTLAAIDNEGFWGSRHQRDLLLVLEKRWSGLPQLARKQLESRLLKGPKGWRGMGKPEFERHRTSMILDRLYWLHQHQCSFTFDLETVAAPFKVKTPEWRLHFAANAAASREPRGGYVNTDKTHSNLLTIPLGLVLSVADFSVPASTGCCSNTIPLRASRRRGLSERLRPLGGL
jgi:SIR2-like domain